MAVKDIFKVSRKTFFAPGAWLGYDFVKNQSIYLWTVLKSLINALFPQKTTLHPETFEQAMQRLSLTEESLKETERLYLLFAAFFALLGVMVIVVAVLFLLAGHLAATLISFGIVAFLFSQAFRYHFWRFQIKHRKLGCTFQEWRTGNPD